MPSNADNRLQYNKLQLTFAPIFFYQNLKLYCMNQQSIKDGTSVRTKAPEEQDILLLANMNKKSLRVASGAAGKTDRFDKLSKEENPPFLKITGANILENFVSNYLRQVENPTHFRFFRVPILDARDIAPHMRELFQDQPSKKMQDFVRQYEVKPVSQLSKQKLDNNNQKNQSNQKNQKNHSNQSFKEQKMETGQTTKEIAGTAPKHRFNEAMINWKQLEQFGISREYLVKTNLLDEMLKGYKTNRLVPIQCNFGSATLKTDARLSFRQMPDGQVAVVMNGLRKEPELGKPYYGHIFSEEDKKNLMDSTGNMGRLAMLSYRGEEKVPCFVSRDKLTNELIAVRAESITVPETFSGVKLTKNEHEALSEGKAIFVEGMTGTKSKEFDAHLQVSAERHGVEYIFNKDGLFYGKSIGGVELTEEQLERLNSKKSIRVDDMTTKDGRNFSSFIHLDVNGNPVYTRYNPDSPEGSREIIIPKEISGVTLAPEDRETLKKGTPVYLYDMTGYSGETFSGHVKLDLETGNVLHSKTLDGFEEKPAMKIPQDYWGHTFTSKERAQLQDGKPVEVHGLKGYDGKEFSSWLKVNQKMGHIEAYTENTDRPRQNAQQTENAAKRQPEKETKKQPEKTDKKQSEKEAKKTSKGLKM
jgi:hypothetical protein